MANGFDPQLSSPGSQARTVAPIVTQAQPSPLQQVLSAAPEIANTAIRAKQASDKQAARVQAAQDDIDTSEAIVARNQLMNQRDELLVLQNDLITAQDDITKMRSDGIITADEEQKIKKFNSDMQKLKSAEAQNLLDPMKFNLQSRKLLNQEIAKNPRIGKELNTIFNQATGGATSPVTGAAQSKQLQLNQEMTRKYQGNWTLEDLKKEAAMQNQVLNAKRNKELGSITIDNIASSVSINSSESIEQVLTPAGQRFTTNGFLNPDEQRAALESLRQRESKIIRSIQDDIFSAQKEGRVVDDAEARALVTEVERNFDEARKYITDKSLQSQLKQRNQLSDELWKAQMGNKISRFQQVSSVMGQGGMTALQSMMAANSDKDRQAIAALAGEEFEGFDLSNFKADMVDAMARISQDRPVPGFEKVDTFLGLKSMKSGPVGEPVKQNTMTNISRLVESPADAADALKSLNDPKIARNFVEGDATTQADFVNKVNSHEALIFNEIQQSGATVRVVQEDPTEGTVGTGRGFLTGVIPTGRTTTGGLRLEVVDTQRGVSTGFLPEAGEERVVVNADLTRKLNTAYQLHLNPQYSTLLQPSIPWLKDVTAQFQLQQQEQSSEQVSE